MSLREGKIGTSEGVAVLSSALIGKLLFPLFSPGFSHSAWLANIVAAAIAAIVFFIALFLLRGGNNLLGGLNQNLSVAGRIIALMLCALLLLNAARTLSGFYLAVKTFVYTDTEPIILMGLLAFAAAIPAYMGLECVSRTAKAFFIIMLIVFVCVLTLPWRRYDSSRLFPLFGEGIAFTLKGGLSGSVLYLDLIGAAVLASALHGGKQVRHIGFASLGISASAAILMFLAAALTFSSGLLREMNAPFYSMASGITSGVSLTRVDDFVLFIWMLCMTAGVSFTLYLASNIFCRTFSVTEIRPVVPLVSFVALSFALLLQTSAVIQGVETFLMQFGFLFAYGPIIMAALIAFIKRLKASAKIKGARL